MRADRPTSSLGRLPAWLIATATLVAMAWIGYWRMFSHFPGYDDEGYILISARTYLEQGNLYGAVYSQYGPAFYALLDGIPRLTGAALDHAFARWFTLTCWLIGAGGTAAVAWRLAKSWSAAWFAGVASFLFLYQFSEEAFHPGAVIVAVLPALLWILIGLLEQRRQVPVAVVAGAGWALLTLLKINVGVLFAAGCGLWFLFTVPGRSGLRWVGVALGVAFSAALMHGLMAQRWVQVFLGLMTVCLGGLAVTGASRSRFSWSALGGLLAGAAVVGSAVVGVIHLRGTSWSALWAGVVLGPLGHANAYSYAIDWRPGTLMSAAFSLATLGLHVRWRQSHPRGAATLLSVLRLIQLAALAAAVALLEHFRVVGALFSFCIPWLWLWVARLPGAEAPDESPAARELVAAVLALQLLHAYPVGGIQLCWGSFLLFALVAPAIVETGTWLSTAAVGWNLTSGQVGFDAGETLANQPARRSGSTQGARSLVAAGLVLVTSGKAAVTAWEYQDYFAAREPLALPGVGGLRLSEREVTTYQAMATNAVLHSDRLFSLPGMFSFNLWAQVPPPTTRNTTLWYSLLTEAEQREIIAALEASARPAVIIDGNLISILQASGAPPGGPLFSHLLERYRPAFTLRGLGFWVRQGRTIAPVGTARVASGTNGFDVWVIGENTVVTSLEVAGLESEPATLARLDATNAQVTAESIAPDGRAQGEAVSVSWPLRVAGLVRLHIESPAFHRQPDQAQVVRLRGEKGELVATAMFADPVP